MSTNLMRALAAALLTYCMSESSVASEYYVAPTGRDSWPGTVDQPWQTIGKANASLRAGDTVYLRSGTYTGPIRPEASGTSGAPIVYRNAPREAPTINATGLQAAVVVSKKEYIEIEGIRTGGSGFASGESFNVDLLNSKHVHLRNVTIVGAASKDELMEQRSSGIRRGGIRLYGGSDNLIENSTIERVVFQGIKLGGGNIRTRILSNRISDTVSDSIRIDQAGSRLQGHIVEGNRLSGSLVGDGIQTNADFDAADPTLDVSNQGVIIRNNVIFGHAENGIDIKGSRFFLVEGNVVFGNTSDNNGLLDGANSRGTPGGMGKGDGGGSIDIIVRRNVFYDNNVGVLITHGWKLYNNTFVGNNRDFTGPGSTYAPPRDQPWFTAMRDEVWSMGSHTSDAAIKNNLMINHFGSEIRLHFKSSIDIDYNLYFNDRSEATMALQRDVWTRYRLNEWQTVLRNLPGFSGYDMNSLVENPMFEKTLDYPIGELSYADFRVARESSAVDSGGPLTRTRSSGSGSTIPVDDVGYFYDGFGVEQGDVIVIGQSPPLRITGIDRTNRTLSVTPSISWSESAPVSLPFAGLAPDMGAIEYEAAAGRGPMPPRLY